MTVSQQGVDVNTATDSQKVIDTRWRYMDILVEKKMVVPSFTQPSSVVLYQHNFGKKYAFSIYVIDSDAYFSDWSQSGGPGVNDLTFSGGVYTDNNAIKISGFFNDSYGISGKNILLRIYNVPITEEYSAPQDVTLAKSISKTSNYGVKIQSRTSHNTLRSNELTDYSLNTQSKALAIHRTGLVAAEVSSNGQATIRHNLGSPPSYMTAFYSVKSGVLGAISPDFVPVRGSANASTITFSGAQAALITWLAYILFKDPADLAL